MVYTIDDLRRIIAPIAEQYGLRTVYVFGSYARREANADSDIDLLVDLTGTNIRSLFALGSVYCDLESALGKSIDLIPVSALEQTSKSTSDDLFRNAVQTERVRIYDAAS